MSFAALDNLLAMVQAVGGDNAHIEIKRHNGHAELRIVGVWMKPRELSAPDARHVIGCAIADMLPSATDKLADIRRDTEALARAVEIHPSAP